MFIIYDLGIIIFAISSESMDSHEEFDPPIHGNCTPGLDLCEVFYVYFNTPNRRVHR